MLRKIVKGKRCFNCGRKLLDAEQRTSDLCEACKLKEDESSSFFEKERREADLELIDCMNQADIEGMVNEILREELELEDLAAEARSNYVREAFEW